MRTDAGTLKGSGSRGEADPRVLGVAVVGCGLVGTRRARLAAAHGSSALNLVVDTGDGVASRLGSELGAGAALDWREAIGRPDVDVLVVATPNAFLSEIGTRALEAGHHVLIEKPAGRTLEEVERLAAAARATGRLCKIGLNHRHHPAIRRAHELYRAGAIGRLVNLRARYGHGARPGCEREWRGDPELAGGGELLDQGVHVADLFRWFAGEPKSVVAMTQAAVWPIAPLEDNAFALLRFDGGVIGQLHVSMTQWRNLFSLEVTGERGTLVAEGLGGSYGGERLLRVRRRMEGGAPDVEEEHFEDDRSWALEWDDFVDAVLRERAVEGDVEDGVAAMRMVDALYRSARAGQVVTL